ncbi:hypothetical protein BGZ93_011347 [Podila epicladia]|nr:hypothetical protein BGZ93_011347 [Podila epicladia]
MTKSGHLNEYYEIPPLNTLKILWSCDPDVIGSHINKDTIGPLIDKAINYLQKLSPPKWMTKLALDHNQSATIKTFFWIYRMNTIQEAIYTAKSAYSRECFGNVSPMHTNMSTMDHWTD